MATEKDIKRFFEETKPEVSNSDEFMADLIRQINLLPVPASLNRRPDENALREQLRKLKRDAKASRRITIFSIIASTILAFTVCVAAVLLFPILAQSSLGESAVDFISDYSLTILCIMFISITMISCINSDVFKI